MREGTSGIDEEDGAALGCGNLADSYIGKFHLSVAFAYTYNELSLLTAIAAASGFVSPTLWNAS